MLTGVQALKPGDQLGRYVLDRPLGAGGMGSVWVAVQEGLGRRVALKVIHANFAMDTNIASRFKREARIAASFNHPSIVPVTDFGVHDGRPYLVMDLLEGESMDELLNREGRLSVDRCAFLAVQILAGLEAAHAKGVIHRDLKPDNVFVTTSSGVGDIARLLDFGIARLSDTSAPKMTSTGQVLGTPAYMAPEQAKGMPVDARSDLYAVGVILYEALSGRVPFEADNYHQLMFAVVEEQPKSLADMRPDLESEFVAIVERAMSKSPEQRFESALAMREALLPFSRTVSLAPVDVTEVSPPMSDTDPLAATMAAGLVPPTQEEPPEGQPAQGQLAQEAAPSMVSAGKRSFAPIVALGVLGALAAIGTIFALQSPPDEQPPPDEPELSTRETVTPEAPAPPLVQPPEETTPALGAPPEPLAEATMNEATMSPGPMNSAMRRVPMRSSVPAAMASTRPGYVTVQCGARENELRVVQPGNRVRGTMGITNDHVFPTSEWLGRLNAHSPALTQCYVGEPIVNGQRIDVVLSPAGRITEVSFFGQCPMAPRVRACLERVLRSVDYSDVIQSGGPATFSLSSRL